MITMCGRNYAFDAELWLPQAPEELFAFFSDAHNLQVITPAFLRFHVLTPKPIDMHAGTLIEYRLKVRGVPIRWLTKITEWEPPHRFVDEQLRGPYRLWQHEHSFTEHDGATKIRDHLEFRSRGGPVAPILHRLFVNRDVESIFQYRTRVLSERFGNSGSVPTGCMDLDCQVPRSTSKTSAAS